MPPTPATQRYILLPSHGTISSATSSPATASFLSSVHSVMAAPGKQFASAAGEPKMNMSVIDSVREHGAKLVELSPADLLALRASQPGVRVVPLVYYRTMERPRATIKTQSASAATTSAKITIRIVSAKDQAPIANATVVAFTNFAAEVGAQGTTNANGQVSLKLGASSKKIERLYIYAQKSFWNGLRKNITLTSGAVIALAPIDLSFVDTLRFIYGNAGINIGTGVKVGVVDTGISAEPDLTINGGFNAVQGEQPGDFGDNGAGHGTHVAGIIAAHGTAPAGIRGLAPGVTLRSYRVFGKGKEGASNFDILKGLDQAVQDGCDLINMSLGGQGAIDPATHDAIAHARANGAEVFAASGNDDRSPVGNPANDPNAIAVSALGRKGTYPANTVEGGDVQSPYGTDKKYYITSFSNIGPEVDLTAPGDGIISTYPGGYAIMDGTSMACPAATGAAARVLAANAQILNLGRDQARSDAIVKLVLQSAKSLGFAPKYQGQGMIRP